MRYILQCAHIFPSIPNAIFSPRAAIFLTSCISIFHFLHLVIYTEPALVWDSLSASAVICGVLPRQGIGFFPCYDALALQLAIHTRLPWPPCSCLCVFIRHLLLSSFDASTPHTAIHTTYLDYYVTVISPTRGCTSLLYASRGIPQPAHSAAHACVISRARCPHLKHLSTKWQSLLHLKSTCKRSWAHSD